MFTDYIDKGVPNFSSLLILMHIEDETLYYCITACILHLLLHTFPSSSTPPPAPQVDTFEITNV